jgi:hypothetical protein
MPDTPETPFGIEVIARGADQDTPPPPAETEQEQKPAKIVFDEAQKLRVNEIVREASARAGSEARAEAARLKTELEAARRAQTPPAPSADVTLELATTRAELAALRSAQEESAVKDSLRAACGTAFIDPDLAVQILRAGVKVVNGKPVPVDSDGNERLGSDFNPMSLKEYAQELAAQKPFLARGQVRGGVGSTPSQAAPSAGPRLEDLFGPKSDGGAANRLALHDPQKYKSLRKLAVEKGLLAR